MYLDAARECGMQLDDGSPGLTDWRYLVVNAKEISHNLQRLADPAIAQQSQRFFKTGKGDYGEGDQFLGIRVPVLRKQAKTYEATPIHEIQALLESAFHEKRLCALLILVRQYKKGDTAKQEQIYNLYLSNTHHINNWDLVDSSAPYIVGPHLDGKDKTPLYGLAKSPSLWERRIAIMATFYFIRKDQFEDALAISQQLLHDDQDLIHKAVGWMLREIGKRELTIEKEFLQDHYKHMPRTMLRYAIEKFPTQERQRYLKGTL